MLYSSIIKFLCHGACRFVLCIVHVLMFYLYQQVLTCSSSSYWNSKPTTRKEKEDLVITTSIFLAVQKLHLIICVFLASQIFSQTVQQNCTGRCNPFSGTVSKVRWDIYSCPKMGSVLNIGAEKENRISGSFPKSWGELYALLWMQSDQPAEHIFPSFFKIYRSELLKRWIGAHIWVSCRPLKNEKYFSICQPWWGWWALVSRVAWDGTWMASE